MKIKAGDTVKLKNVKKGEVKIKRIYVCQGVTRYIGRFLDTGTGVDFTAGQIEEEL